MPLTNFESPTPSDQNPQSQEQDSSPEKQMQATVDEIRKAETHEEAQEILYRSILSWVDRTRATAAHLLGNEFGTASGFLELIITKPETPDRIRAYAETASGGLAQALETLHKFQQPITHLAVTNPSVGEANIIIDMDESIKPLPPKK